MRLMSRDAKHLPPDGVLQFDDAIPDAGAPALPTCLDCGQPVHGYYYERDGAVLCSTCKGVTEQKLGTQGAAFRRALLFGLVAAAISAGIWLAVLIATDSTFGLLAIVVGLVVGGAVKAGARGRGGRRYQVLAGFLTYLAIGASYVPLFISAAIKAEATRRAPHASPARADSVRADSVRADSAREAQAADAAAEAAVAEGERAAPAAAASDGATRAEPHLTAAEEAADDSASAAATLSATAEARRLAARRESRLPGPAIVRIPLALVVVVGGLLVMALASPLVLAFVELPRSLITFAFTVVAVNIAWKATGGSSVRLTGPYKVGVPRAGLTPAA
jgi:hypothetical protein